MKQWYYDKDGKGVIAEEKPDGYDFDFRGNREYDEVKEPIDEVIEETENHVESEIPTAKHKKKKKKK